MIAEVISFIFISEMQPIELINVDLSAVNNLLGRIKLCLFKPPSSKSTSFRLTANRSLFAMLVIWERITSSPPQSAITNSGLRFDPVKSENGP
jgi:hypothetical protein